MGSWNFVLSNSAYAIDARARRAARRVGLVAMKSRWGVGSLDNFGGYQLLHPESNFVVDGSRFDMTAEDVIEFCRVSAATEQQE